MPVANDPDALFRRYRRDAVLLHQPWPPHAGPPTNSHFGGLPRLPESHAWPRTSTDTPLHFLAQIDCADIGFQTVLPERGVLFFFGRDDVRAWNGAPASDTCRVLYALDADPRTPLRQAPADLPPLQSPLTESNVHFGWPVVPLPFDSFPEESALPYPSEPDARPWRRLLDRFVRDTPNEPEISEELREAYDAQLNARRVAALVAAAGPPRTGSPVPARESAEAGRAIFHFADSGPESFPRHWAYIHHLARRILDLPLIHSLGEETPGERVAEAQRWLARSREVPLEQPVAEDDRQALRAWLSGLDYPGLVSHAAADAIRSFASDPALAALVPDHVYAACASDFYDYHEANPRFSQMLGHAPACHQARDVDDPIVCLLNIDADRGLAWPFAGMNGKVTFWITPDALARRDFSHVVGRLDGR